MEEKEMDIEKNKELVLGLLNTCVKREGKDKLLAWLEKSDFFTAPASTKYNLPIPGGLVEHAINRLKSFLILLTRRNDIDLNNIIREYSVEGAGESGNLFYFGNPDTTMESIVLMGLLADVNKVNCYRACIKNVKNKEANKWEEIDGWEWEEKFIYPTRGTKTVFILQQFIRLFVEEVQALAFINAGELGLNTIDTTYREIYEGSPLAVYLHLAEVEAMYVLDGKNESI